MKSSRTTTPHIVGARAAVRRRSTLAAAAAMTGLFAIAHPGAAIAAPPDASETTKSVDWLDLTWSGGDDSTVVATAGVPGGGTTVSFLQKPLGQDDKAEPRTLTLSVEGDAIAAETAVLEDGSMVPTADSDLGAEHSEGVTTLTVEATGEMQTVIFLPEDAPRAADPDDQDDVDGWWSKLRDWTTGEDDDGDDREAQENIATKAPTSTSPSEPSSTSDPSSTSTNTSSRRPTGGDVCLVTQGQDQQGAAEVSEGEQDEDYAVSDGPTAAASFSEEIRTRAAAAASDCGEGRGAGSGRDEDSKEPDGLVSAELPSTAEGVTRANVATGDWLSGAAGDPAGIGELRGTSAEVATTWANGGSNGIAVPQLQSGGEYAADAWNKSLIVSVSPFEDGGSWAEAAAGDYDADWTQQLTNIEDGWGDRDGTLFVSLAWELNGNWFPWAVTAEQTDDFRTAWARYRALQQRILPEALLTLTMNKESNGYDGDSSDLIVKGELDAYGVDYYNHFPYAATDTEFIAALDERDGGGGPKGLEAHRETAEAAGVPLVLPEWNGSAKNGDAPGFFTGMHSFFAAHAGPGAGQLLAESLFEIDKDDNNWALLGDTRMPKSAQLYAKVFSDVGGQS